MTTLCQITMNAGDDISGSVIKWNLKKHSDKFDRVIVVDGNLTERAKEFYSQFKNLEWVDSPWADSYVAQYEAWKAKLKNGEWALYLDCDEIPSEELIEACTWINSYPEISKWDIIRVPCILHLNESNKYYAAEQLPPKFYKPQMWTKNILLENCDNIYFRHFGSHVIPETKEQDITYTPSPYYHMKSLESFIYNDVWQAFLLPKGQQYTEIEDAQFKIYTKQYKTTKEFKQATIEGKWPPFLKKFAWERRWFTNRPISRLAWAYFLLYEHSFLEKDENFTWENVKQYVLGKESMELFEKNKREGNFIDVSL